MCKANLGWQGSLQSWKTKLAINGTTQRNLTQSCNLAKSMHAISLSMHPLQFLTRSATLPYAINRRTFAYTLGTHPGGRGCACAPAFFLYYYHPPHNFFCNIAPSLGALFAHGYAGVTPPCLIPFMPPYPPCIAYSMASIRGVWYCSLS